MTLQNVYPWIEEAHREGYAIGAFNANTMEQMQAIVLGAQAENAPVIIQVSHRALQYVGSGREVRGLQYMAALGQVAAASVDVPVSLHLDHANENEVLQAIALGFTSVMFDGDYLPFEENIATTKRLCAIAHDAGVCMEAEIGEVPKPDGAAYDPNEIALTTPDEAETFVQATGIDILAIALGSVHGLKDKSVSLDLARLQAIRARVETPLVLHGSSGVNNEDIAEGIKHGLAKINIATQLSKAFTGAVREVLAADGELVDPRKYLGPGRAAQIEAVRERIRFVGGGGQGMILCVNLNAAIDKTAVINTFQLGQIHRPELIKMLPGGKGCNVARALKLLGEDPVVTGWVGGSAGQFIENGLQQEGIGTDFVYTAFESRTCLSILDSSSQVLTEIYEKGDTVPPVKVAEMLALFEATVGKYTAVTLSGSMPPGVPTDFYAQLIKLAHKASVPAFLDSSKEALLQGVAAKPFLIKPNETEVAVLAQRELTSLADFAAAAAEISTRFETIVVLSLGKDGAIAAQGETAVHVQNPVVEARSAVGSGDSLLAGLVVGFGNGRSLAESVRVGVAAGTANTLMLGAAQFTRQDFERIYAETAVK